MTNGTALRRRWRLRLGLVLAGAVGISALTASGAPASVTPPAPTTAPAIISGPTGVTSSTTATFAYQHTQTGVTFQCSLDGAPFKSCASNGVTYAGLTNGSHTFRVSARRGSSPLGPSSSRGWTVDRNPPSIVMTAPTSGIEFDAAAWNLACGTTPGVCGAAVDPAGVAEVRVAVLQVRTGRYWNGTSFSATTAQFLLANGVNPWTLPLPLPADGRYQALVRAKDAAGNQTSGAGVRTSFAIDTRVPVVPLITASPEDIVTSTTATFRFETPNAERSRRGDDDNDDGDDDDGGDEFECSLDDATFRTCESPQRYRNLALGNHCFSVRSRNEAGRASDPATWCWLIVVDNFPIAGDIPSPFLPGLRRTLDLRITNPYPFPLKVVDVVVAVRATTSNAGCVGNVNLVPLRQLGSQPVVPANSTATLSSLGIAEASWPELTMPNLPTNQDACMNATFTLTYTGRGTKA